MIMVARSRAARSLAIHVLALAALGAAEAAPNEAHSGDRAAAERMLAAYVFVANGSGVVVSADGLVFTNHHVIDGEDDLSVRFADGTTYPTVLLGTDPVGDIALLRIQDQRSFPHVPLAGAESIRAGMDVLAVGNPFGLGDADSTPTLTRGVLSTARIVREDYTDALQGDAPVNPGNSGGPLFDTQARLLGINGQIRTLSGMRINSGVGLAICATQLAAFRPLLEAAGGGYVHHSDAPRGLALIQRGDGVYVREGAGPLVAGDRLVAIADRPVVSVANAIGLFASLPWTADITVAVAAERAGERLQLAVPAARKAIPGKAWHGLVVDQRDDGLRVQQVDDDSPAKRAEIGPGDLLLEANGRSLARKLDFLKALVKLEVGDWLELKVKRSDGSEKLIRILLKLRQ
ncbi:MAG: trypsin-like peptidase domain-containing protein [Planctomycetes bacterium]|nr:trypsin-like peptidase domain-containing protein [Planctomycetota bacterium]